MSPNVRPESRRLVVPNRRVAVVILRRLFVNSQRGQASAYRRFACMGSSAFDVIMFTFEPAYWSPPLATS